MGPPFELKDGHTYNIYTEEKCEIKQYDKICTFVLFCYNQLSVAHIYMTDNH